MRWILPLTLLLVVTNALAQPKLFRNFEGPSGTPTLGSSPHDLVKFKGEAYFQATNPKYGPSLWHSDGTAEGTKMLDGFRKLPFDSYLTPFGDWLLYVGGQDDQGVWKTDGSQTVRIIEQGDYDPIVGTGGRAKHIIPVNDHLFYFFGYDPDRGNELWKSDGTTAGTSFVKDIYPGTASSIDYQLVTANAGDLTYFYATDGVHGYELWRTDGTEDGTKMVKEITPDNNGYITVNDLRVFNDEVYFLINNRLWKSNGEEDGTIPITDEYDAGIGGPAARRIVGTIDDELIFTIFDSYADGEKFYRLSNGEIKRLFPDGPQPIPAPNSGTMSASFKGDLYFDAVDQTGGPSVWKYDGTETTMVTDLGAHDIETMYRMIAGNNILYFIATETPNEYFLWKSDGTPAGTSVITAIDYSTVGPAIAVGDKLFYVNGNYATTEVWVSDGTYAGTHVTKDIVTSTDTTPYLFLKIGEEIYFKGWDQEHGFELWKTNGTEEGTMMVKDITPGAASSDLQSFYKAGDQLAFVVQDEAQGGVLWTSDGTLLGTTILLDPEPASPGIGPSYVFYRFKDKLVFSVTASNSNNGLWITDGTQAGTSHLIGPSGLEQIGGIGTLGDKFYLFVGTKLWATDGTVVGTAIVRDLLPDASPIIHIGGVYAMTGETRFYFYANDAQYAQELWVSDGTADGTKKIHIREAPEDPNLYPFFCGIRGDQVFFRTASEHNYELWTSDGTEEGTVMFKEFNPGDKGSWNSTFLYHGNTIYFEVMDDEHGVELWKSDGTANGTTIVKDIMPGSRSSQAYPIVPMSTLENGDMSFELVGPNDNEIYIVANDGIHGFSLWATDGTPEKTHMVADLIPGPADSYVSFGEKLGDRFYFIFNDYSGHNGIWYIDDGSQWITFDPIEDKIATDAPFGLTATSSSGLPVTFTIVSGPATISNNKLTITGGGEIVVRATTAGNADYNAAEAVEQSFIVTKISQTIAFNEIPDKKSNDAPFTIAATATSNLPITFTVVSGPATVSGNTITLTGAGIVTIKAEQPGNNIYSAAASVQRTFTVELVVGLEEDINQQISVYPNPASDRLYIQSASVNVQSVSLIDALGRNVAGKTLDRSSNFISIEDLPQGVYVLRLMTGTTNFTARIHVKR